MFLDFAGLRWMRFGLTGSAVLVAGVVAINCSNAGDSCEETSTCSARADAGGRQNADGAVQKCVDPLMMPCAIDDEHGVFVSARLGSDGGNGTQASPYKAIGPALIAASSKGLNVYVCADGQYAESFKLGPGLDGSSIYGGFTCAGGIWAYAADTRAQIISPQTTVFDIDGLSRGLVLSDFDLEASDAMEPGRSSIAVWVKSSQRVTLRHVRVTAGRGADASSGGNGDNGKDGSPPGLGQNGKIAICNSAQTEQSGGSWVQPSTCGSQGGAGGTALRGEPTSEQAIDNDAGVHAEASNGEAGAPVTNVDRPGTQNGGIAPADTGKGEPGHDGASGNPGTNGLQASIAGQFTREGFVPASGQPGTDGFPGQGGGGGSASKAQADNCLAASGGAGGMGGCGGKKGLGGNGGGASVAVLAWESPLTLDQCDLIAKDGGAGGKGGNGGAAGAGARGGEAGLAGSGLATGIAAAGRGGDGGPGGPGGSGSGGTGGPSYPLVEHNTAITKIGGTLTKGSGGAPGSGGVLGTLLAAPSGFAGDAQLERSL